MQGQGNHDLQIQRPVDGGDGLGKGGIDALPGARRVVQAHDERIELMPAGDAVEGNAGIGPVRPQNPHAGAFRPVRRRRPLHGQLIRQSRKLHEHPAQIFRNRAAVRFRLQDERAFHAGEDSRKLFPLLRREEPAFCLAGISGRD